MKHLAVLLVALTLVTGCTAVPVPEFDPAAPIVFAPPPDPDTPPDPVGELAADVLARLPVKGRAPMTGYTREQFGEGWADVDGDGCDTRADILRRDAVPGTAVFDDGCVVGAQVEDPYGGTIVTETPGRGSDVDIDHVVALGNAWATGAQQLDPVRREQLANDPANLLAVDDTLNQQKADADAATWLPPERGYRCLMVARQIAVKARYGLWVTVPERDAMVRVLGACPAQMLPS